MDRRHRDWSGYYDALTGRSPRPLLVEALVAAGEKGAGRSAVDLGFGDGTETRALLGRGWRVFAIDGTPDAGRRLEEAVTDVERERLVVEIVDFSEAEIPECDLLFAGLSIPFCHPSAFAALWNRMTRALRPDGVLACHLFGVRDTWSAKPDMSFVDADAARGLVATLDVLAFRELEHDGDSYAGPKHWHLFEVVARQPAG